MQKNQISLDTFIHFTLFWLDFRNILTSETTPEQATEATTLTSSSLKTTTVTTKIWFTENADHFNNTKSTEYFSKDNLEVESSTYVTIQQLKAVIISIFSQNHAMH